MTTPTTEGQRVAGNDWHFWADDPPPHDSKIQACYSLSDQWMDGETCKGHRGCLCFYDRKMGHMTRPNFWRYP